MATKFSNSEGTGSVTADGFNATSGSSSSIPNLSTSGLASAGPPQLVTAAGATQGAATAITRSLAILVVVTASARGARLPAAVTGRKVQVMSGTTQGCKIYPAAGDKIGAAATNAAVVLAGNKSNLYVAQDAVTWRVQVGA